MKLMHWCEAIRFQVVQDPRRVFAAGSVLTLYDIILNTATAEVDETDYVELSLRHFLEIDGELVNQAAAELALWHGSLMPMPKVMH